MRDAGIGVAAFHKQIVSYFIRAALIQAPHFVASSTKSWNVVHFAWHKLAVSSMVARALFAALWGPTCHESYQGFLAHLAHLAYTSRLSQSVVNQPFVQCSAIKHMLEEFAPTYTLTFFFLFSTIIDISL